jgi:hypothetical protein
MARRLLLLLQLESALSVNMKTGGPCRRWSVIPENAAQVMQEPCGGQEDGGVFELVHMVEEELGIDIALRR